MPVNGTALLSAFQTPPWEASLSRLVGSPPLLSKHDRTPHNLIVPAELKTGRTNMKMDGSAIEGLGVDELAARPEAISDSLLFALLRTLLSHRHFRGVECHATEKGKATFLLIER